MDDDRQTGAELEHNFHLLACSPAKLNNRSYTKILHDIAALVLLYSSISAAIKSCIYIFHSVSECQSDESAEFVIFFRKIGCNGNVS